MEAEESEEAVGMRMVAEGAKSVVVVAMRVAATAMEGGLVIPLAQEAQEAV